MLKWFAVCVCKILHVNLYMIPRNVFKVYKKDDQILYTRNTACSETWQNEAPISSFSAQVVTLGGLVDVIGDWAVNDSRRLSPRTN